MSSIRSVSRIEKLPGRYWALKRLRLRRHPKGIFGTPDFGSKSKRIAVFIDGCFWHCCPRHFSMPKSNVEFWTKKFNRNIARDREVTAALKAQGFHVVRIWEHSL